MLSDTLSSNQIKNRAGTGISFQRLYNEGRKAFFAKVGEGALRHRLTIGHQESGSGINLRRRSLTRFDLTVLSQVDALTPVVIGGYTVLDSPVGHLTDTNSQADVLANLMSLLAATGAGTTILFDGTGNGAQVLLTGSL